MSAYMVDRDHIDFLVSAMLDTRICRHGFHWYWHESSRSLSGGELVRAAEIGQLLWSENLKSIQYRYGDRDNNDASFYVYGEHDFRAWAVMDPVQIIKAVYCYQYQACEHDGWKDSEAKCITDSLVDYVCQVLPGYDAAKWGPPEQKRKLLSLAGVS